MSRAETVRRGSHRRWWWSCGSSWAFSISRVQLTGPADAIYDEDANDEALAQLDAVRPPGDATGAPVRRNAIRLTKTRYLPDAVAWEKLKGAKQPLSVTITTAS